MTDYHQGTRLGAGVYVTDDGTMHIDLGEVCDGFDRPRSEENLANALEGVKAGLADVGYSGTVTVVAPICPVCLLEACERPHPDCSPGPAAA